MIGRPVSHDRIASKLGGAMGVELYPATPATK